jgi:hypothetical protein
MKRHWKTILAAASVAIGLCVLACEAKAQEGKQKEPGGLAISEMEIDPGEAMKAVDETKEKLFKDKPDSEFPPQLHEKNGACWGSGDIMGQAARLSSIAGSLNVEEDSGCSRKWFASLSSTLFALARVKLDMEGATGDGNKDEYLKQRGYYEQGVEYYVKLANNPQKLSKDEMKKVAQKNKLLRKKAAEKQAKLAAAADSNPS